ncbi:hypothetical protein BSKO_07693 [Bryopsis sp. KO-2023]|nr:hypothetical protein BSKO_07693 [Bryopsis sp. KO-2023]
MGRVSSDGSRSPKHRREKSKHKSKDRRDKEKDRHKDKERRDRGKDVERRDRDKRSERRKEKDRKDHERPKSRDHDRSRDRERRRERESEKDKHRSKRDRESRPSEHHESKRRKESLSEADEEALAKKKQEEEAARLDEEVEKRRKRVEMWQAQRRKEEATKVLEQNAEKEETGGVKQWTLEDDDDDDDEQQTDVVMANGGEGVPVKVEKEELESSEVKKEEDVKMEDGDDDDEVDPLEAFMAAEIIPQVELDVEQAIKAGKEAEASAIEARGKADAAAAASASEVKEAEERVKKKKPFNPYDSDSSGTWEEEEEEEEELEDDEEWFRSVQSGKLTKGDKLGQINHAEIDYPPFRRCFYIEVPELTRMTDEEVAENRKELDDIKVRGKNIPKPIKTWTQCGVGGRMLDVLKKNEFEKPLPIQAQALPIIMSGRDCIGIAKTGSGKTLAFVIPMLRHIKDQSPLEMGDGPIGMVMAPTRELVQQIGKEIRRFAKALDVTTVCVFGGSGVANQISELKRGCEIVVCTPGRMIDLLVTSNGKITNLRRVTYLVLDEADRMFDMGFEPQIMRIVNNIRPNRQTVMFSATFPRQVELIARRILDDPVEILVGGRSVVNSDITQYVEIRPEDDRFFRLLEILGEWYEEGKILVFVNSQDKCDSLFRDLIRHGYPCSSLHGGKEQSDRECTIADFKGDVCSILIATSVAARGLDVKDLILVVNHDVPNHHEDYVHRVGRTGRAGNKGTAITFIAEDEDKFAPDLVKALKESKAPVPQDLQNLADAFSQKKKQGLVQGHGSGYGGSGFKFDYDEEDKRKAARKAVAKEYGLGEDESDDDEDGLDPRPVGAAQQDVVKAAISTAQAAADSMAAGASGVDMAIQNLPQVQAAHQLAARLTAMAQGGGSTVQVAPPPVVAPAPVVPPQQQSQAADNPILTAAKWAAGQIAAKVGIPAMPPPAVGASGGNAAQRAAALAYQFSAQHGSQPMPEEVVHYEAELEINDFAQHARWKITHRDTLSLVTELTGAAITTRGQYFRPGSAVPPGERKLYLLIEGSSESSTKKAKAELRKILAETQEKVMRRDPPSGKYSVM